MQEKILYVSPVPGDECIFEVSCSNKYILTTSIYKMIIKDLANIMDEPIKNIKLSGLLIDMPLIKNLLYMGYKIIIVKKEI